MSAARDQYRLTDTQPIESVDEFLAGQRDCEAGIPHQPGRTESYDRGYATEYELEQIRDFNTGIRV